MYQFETNLISEGSVGAYLLTIFGEEWQDWRPVILHMMFMEEHKN